MECEKPEKRLRRTSEDTYVCPNAGQSFCTHKTPFRYQKAFLNHRCRCRPPISSDQLSTLVVGLRKLQEEFEQLKMQIQWNEEQTKQPRARYPNTKYHPKGSNAPKPAYDFGSWTERAFAEALPAVCAWYQNACGLSLLQQVPCHIIANVLFWMNGKVQVVQFNTQYPKDPDGRELFMDLIEKTRWWYRIPVSIAMKRLREGAWLPKLEKIQHLFAPAGGPKGWNYLAHFVPLKSNGDRGLNSWQSKYRILEALARYRSPEMNIEDQNFADSVEEYGAAFWEECATPEELADYYAMGLESSARWHQVARKLCNQRAWGREYLAAINEIRARRRLEPLAELP